MKTTNNIFGLLLVFALSNTLGASAVICLQQGENVICTGFCVMSAIFAILTVICFNDLLKEL